MDSESMYFPCNLLPMCTGDLCSTWFFWRNRSKASKQGVLVKGSNYLEALSEMKTIVFDKTGTLTKGEFVVSEVIPNGWEKEGLLEVAPLRKAIPIIQSQQTQESVRRSGAW